MKVFSLGLAICVAMAVTTELAISVAAGSSICATPDDFADTGASADTPAVTSSTGSQTTAPGSGSTSDDSTVQTSTSSTDDDDTTAEASSSSTGSEGTTVQGSTSSSDSNDDTTVQYSTSSTDDDDDTTAQGSTDSTGSDGTAVQGSADSTGTSTQTSGDKTSAPSADASSDAVNAADSSSTESDEDDDSDSAVDATSSTTSDISSGSDATQDSGGDVSDGGETTPANGDSNVVSGSSNGDSSSVDAANNNVSSQSYAGNVSVQDDSTSASTSTTPSSTTGGKTGITIGSTTTSVTGSRTSSTSSSTVGQFAIEDSNATSDVSSTTSSASTAGSASTTAQDSASATASPADETSSSTSGSNTAQVSPSASTMGSASASSSAWTSASASTASSTSSSISSSSSSSSSTIGTFTKVTSLQARVQGDMPEWNEDNQRFVSAYYDTFDEKYQAVLDTVNMASVEGALKYVQAECINSSAVTDCERKNNIKYVVFYQTTIVQPTASMEYYANATDEYDFAVEHCPFMAMDGGQCDPNEDGSFPDVCNQYIGADGQPDLGFCVGGTLQDNEVIAPYPHNYWFSFPNSCPQELWDDKTESCREEYAGGMCAVGVEPDGVNCTFSYEILGYILLDDVVGITKLINPLTLDYYADYYEFCEAGGIEFAVSLLGDIVSWIGGLSFWANPGNSEANAERVLKLVAAYDELVSTNATTSDGGLMKALPTVDELNALNPPCYENSPICAEAEFGCKRSYRSQICQVCTSEDSDCIVKS